MKIINEKPKHMAPTSKRGKRDFMRFNLSENEKILWKGQPCGKNCKINTNVKFTFFLGLWLTMTISMIIYVSFTSVAPFLAVLFLLPFLVYGCVRLMNFRILSLKKTYYYITNKRIFLFKRQFSKLKRTQFIYDIPYIELIENTDGSYNIHFGHSYNTQNYFLTNGGFDWMEAEEYSTKEIVFCNIDSYHDLLNVIMENKGDIRIIKDW